MPAQRLVGYESQCVRGINQATKFEVYKAVVLPTLLYACETWTFYERHMECLRKLLKITWQGKVRDRDSLQS
jgi:hypothetical protein